MVKHKRDAKNGRFIKRSKRDRPTKNGRFSSQGEQGEQGTMTQAMATRPLMDSPPGATFVAPLGLPRHILSAAWGDMPPGDFAALVIDVGERGIIHPILIWDSGDGPAIADGWHRYLAAQECGCECPAVEYHGDIRSLAELVESENRHRRHVPDRYAIGLAVARVRVASAATGDETDGLTVQDVADSLAMSKRHYQSALAQARYEQGVTSPAGGRPREDTLPVEEQSPGESPALGSMPEPAPAPEVDIGLPLAASPSPELGGEPTLTPEAVVSNADRNPVRSDVADLLNPEQMVSLAKTVQAAIAAIEDLLGQTVNTWPEGETLRPPTRRLLEQAEAVAEVLPRAARRQVRRRSCRLCGEYLPDDAGELRTACPRCVERPEPGSVAADVLQSREDRAFAVNMLWQERQAQGR